MSEKRAAKAKISQTQNNAKNFSFENISSQNRKNASEQNTKKIKTMRAKNAKTTPSNNKKSLSFKILRQKGINLLRKRRYKDANIAFCLAYELKASDEILSFIELCDFTKRDEDGVNGLFAMYCANTAKNQEKNLAIIIDILQKTTYAKSIKESQDLSISYDDFCEIVRQNGDFATTFERVIHSTRIVISDKKSLVNFISRLIDSGYIELAMHYIETTRGYIANEIDALTQKLKSKNEF